MAEEKIILAIFDFDGTLTTGHMWSGIARHHRENKVKRFAVYYYFLSHLPLWLAAKAKIYDEQKDKIKWGEDLPSLIRGFTVEDAHQVFEWVADKYFISLLRPDVVGKLEEHKKKGHKTMILSGMFTDFLEVMASRIGVDCVVGTKLQIVNGVYTGKIIKPLCFGEDKARYLNEYIRDQHLNVDLGQSAAYADAISDIPVLLMVGNPVACYPDKALLQFALNQKWQIIGDSAPPITAML
jgi:HAD superfamily hydrolase (TIGR01490 family)